ncbi:MAG: hypothetical protein QXR89_03825 [Candidatus Bathyarchaeia archaeon]
MENGGEMEELGLSINLKHFILPKNNHWRRRIILAFTFILFDCLSTMLFCRAPSEEANIYARAFMEVFGIPAGLALFVLTANFPIYMVLSLDSHIVKFPANMAMFVELFTDFVFAWFIAGLHFSGGTSWFWRISDIERQFIGMMLYLCVALIFVKPHKPQYG